MDEATARARLERYLAPSMEPVITSADLDDLIARSRREDADGVLPSETGYVDTWTAASIDAALSEGWEIRAGRCFDDYDFGEDGQRFNRSQRHQQCLNMAKLYRRGVSGGGSGHANVPSIVSSTSG